MADCVERGGDVCDNEEGGMRMRCMTVKYCSDSPDGQVGREEGRQRGRRLQKQSFEVVANEQWRQAEMYLERTERTSI